MPHQHLDVFHGLPVCELAEDDDDPPAPLLADSGRPCDLPADQVAWRVGGAPYEEEGDAFGEALERLLRHVDPALVKALVVGWWGPGWEGTRSDVVVSALVAAADRLTALEAVFVGDIVSEESEISWIEHGDLTPLLTAYPGLRRLEVRGGSGLRLDPVEHHALTALRFESGGLPSGVVRGVGASTLPALRHLEMWLGVSHYSGDSGPGDWAGVLSGAGLPALRHLGLQNSERQDEVAAAVATAPVVARLESLSLSMGTLSDAGAEALLSGQPLTHLRELDLGPHYVSEAMVERLRAALPGVRVLGEPEPENRYHPGYRYVQISE
ncbi:STM4015 family protein [Nonomuraea longicatena]|uniref:Leucine-rich repeat domain-containing protein n=1 Tax=Nonomuraea longicatena TaxID=83682 RepID=A0ABN1QG80_9ACTN